MSRWASLEAPSSKDPVSDFGTRYGEISPIDHLSTEKDRAETAPEIYVGSDEFPSVVRKDDEGNKYMVPMSGTKHDPTSAPEALEIDPQYAAAHDATDQHYPSQYQNADEKERARFLEHETAGQSQPSKRKRPRWVIPLVIAIGVIIVVAVVVGATLGTILNKKKNPAGSDSSSGSSSSGSSSNITANATTVAWPYVETLANTGLASVQLLDGSELLAVYYQAPDLSIVELLFDGTAATEGNFTPIAQSIILLSSGQNGAPGNGTPLAALSYHYHDQPDTPGIRQVWYTDEEYNLWQMNVTNSTASATSSAAWQSSTPVTNPDYVTQLEAGSSGLAACVDPGYEFVSVFWSGTGGQGPQNMYMVAYSTNQTFTYGEQDFGDYDLTTQYACSAWYDRSSGINFYQRNNATGYLNRWIDAYEGGTFVQDPTPGPYLTSGSGLAANNDGSSTDFLFFEQLTGNLGGEKIAETIYNPPVKDTVDSTEWTNITTSGSLDLGPLANASRMAASWYTNNGNSSTVEALYLFYQNKNTTEIQVLTTDGSNTHAFNNTVQAVGSALGT